MNLKSPLTLTFIAAMITLIIFGVFLRWNGITFSIKPTEILNVLSPLLLAAGFVERAVEVLISPWRDTDANKLQIAVNTAKGAAVPVPADIQQVKNDLSQYKGTTQKYAFAISLALGFAIGISGVRCLQPLLDASKFSSVTPAQKNFFLVVDVALTASLLAGGADGIHSVVEAFTSFFNASAKKSQSAAG